MSESDDGIVEIQAVAGPSTTTFRRSQPKTCLTTIEAETNNMNDPTENIGAEADDDSSGVDDEWVAHCRVRGKSRKHSRQVAVSRDNIAIQKKRPYRFIKRLCRTKQPSKMRTRWLEILQKTDEDIRQIFCCSSRRCFSALNIYYLREKMSHLLSAPLAARKSALHSMATSEGSFVFDGQHVCSEFLRKAFRFSLEVQAAARKFPSSALNGMSAETLSSVYSLRHSTSISGSAVHAESVPCTMSNVGLDSILTFIDRLADETADSMPDNGEFHLPFFRKKDVYEIFQLQYKKLYPTRQVPSQSYFLMCWKNNRDHIKVRRESRFTKCGTCERLRSALADAIRKGIPTDDLKKEKLAHNQFIAMERREYLRKAEMAMLQPSKYISIVVDGADQSAFSLPHFVTKTKETRGEGLKVHLIGLLQHLSVNKLSLFTMTDDHDTGANHIIECIHRFINDTARDGTLPRQLFVQLDNCVRENKNNYLLSYLDALVWWGIFDSIEIGFLPVGHTHCDIDQAFSTTAERLRYHDAITLSDLQHEVSKCYNGKTTVSRLKQLVNWSGLCDKSKCNNNIKHITQYRYFKFSASSKCNGNNIISSICHVRSSCTDGWKSLESENSPGITGVLKFLPDLSQTPPERVESPQNVDKFMQKLDSERGRIVPEVKMRSLVSLKNEIFRDKTFHFHWNLSSILENNISRNSERNDMLMDSPSVIEPAEQPYTEYSYDVGSFVAVNTGNANDGHEFWIARVIDVQNKKGRKTKQLSVNWYQYYGGTNIYNGKYKPHFLRQDEKKSEKKYWVDNLSLIHI